MSDRLPEEAKNFRLLGHDSSAAFGGGSIVEVSKGFAYVGSVGGSSFSAPEGFTVHDVSDPRKPHKVAEFRAPPGVHPDPLGRASRIRSGVHHHPIGACGCPLGARIRVSLMHANGTHRVHK